MKKIATLFSMVLLVVSLAATNPAIAQSSKDDDTTTSRNKDNDNDAGKWGLAGLAGLLGLLGLKRNDDRDRVHRTDTTRVRP